MTDYPQGYDPSPQPTSEPPPVVYPTGFITTAPPPPKMRKMWPWIAGGMAAVIAIVAVGVYFALPSTEDRAVTYCQDGVIRAALKAPATAKFGEATVEHEDGTSWYTVRGAVDAQNGFGALVRADYSCNLRREGDHWVATSKTFEQR